jgi:hypothetical protein
MFHLYLKALQDFWFKSLEKTGMSELHSFYIGKDVSLDVSNSGPLKYATVNMEAWNLSFKGAIKTSTS